MAAMNKTAPFRPSSRETLAALTQDRIMEGVASLLRGGGGATFDLVARESGVPQRTLYRYFPNKEALFDAFWRWTNDHIEMPALPKSAEEVVAHIPALFAAFDRDEPLVRAMLHNRYGRAVRLAHADARRKKFSDALRELVDVLPQDNSQRLLAAVTALCSASGWETMKDNWRLSGPAAAAAAQWAVQALIDDAHRLAKNDAAPRRPKSRSVVTERGRSS
jgi:AcrR family transcriptional regulator